MHEKLFDKLCEILDDMERKDKLTASDLQIIDWATHAKKSMLSVDEMECGYSEEMGGYSRGGSYARGRSAKRDSMGRYSRDGYSRTRESGYSRNYSRGQEEYVDQLHELMESAPDEKTRQSIQRMIREMDQA